MGNTYPQRPFFGRGFHDAAGFSGKASDTTVYYTFDSYSTPSTLLKLDISSGSSSIYRVSKAPFDSDAYVSKQIFYASKDGTQVPMIITHPILKTLPHFL